MKGLLCKTLLIVGIYSCQNGKIESNNVTLVSDISLLIQNCSKDVDLQQFKVLLIIPARGCDSCIKQSMDFFYANYQDQDIGYVISGLSHREAKVIIRDEIINSNNVLIDSLDYAHRLKILDVKPKIIYLSIDGIDNVIELTAINSKSALDNIKSTIKKVPLD